MSMPPHTARRTLSMNPVELVGTTSTSSCRPSAPVSHTRGSSRRLPALRPSGSATLTAGGARGQAVAMEPRHMALWRGDTWSASDHMRAEAAANKASTRNGRAPGKRSWQGFSERQEAAVKRCTHPGWAGAASPWRGMGARCAMRRPGGLPPSRPLSAQVTPPADCCAAWGGAPCRC